MMMVSAVFCYCSIDREGSSSKRGSVRLKDWLPRAVITNLLASSPLRLNDFPRDPVFTFWISELSDLIAAVKRLIASVGLNTLDHLLLFEDVAGYNSQIYLFTYLAIHLSFSLRSMFKSSPVGLKDSSNVISSSHSFICVYHMFCRFCVIAYSICCCFRLYLFFVIVMLATRSDKYERERRNRIPCVCLLYNSITSFSNMNSSWL